MLLCTALPSATGFGPLAAATQIVSGNGTGGSQSKVKPLLCTALLPATGFRPTATRDFHECEPHPFPPILEAKVEEEGESI
ncbi:hypothetical protein HZH66_005577 [Vespula vulgaris]|uniref:Uncharacterized protein n=1 Tax=Vespula vulgaris TaxID=7454 RepID=A0A834K5F5_VESVU|nr:hypothetical protein HZH66_005577 [Vespula vulgaris]